MKKKQKILLFVVTPIVVIAGIIYWLTWSGSTDHIESVADQFKADSSWQLSNHYAVPPKTDCIAQVCPRLGKVWKTPTPVTQEVIEDILRKSGWNNVRVDDECIKLREVNPKPYSCSFHGQTDKYTVSIYADINNPRYNSSTLSLSLE